MARKKSFEEYREENLREQEKIKKQIEDARLKQLQAEHCIQRAENQIAYQKKKKEKARVHRLITKGAAIEAICKRYTVSDGIRVLRIDGRSATYSRAAVSFACSRYGTGQTGNYRGGVTWDVIIFI